MQAQCNKEQPLSSTDWATSCLSLTASCTNERSPNCTALTSLLIESSAISSENYQLIVKSICLRSTSLYKGNLWYDKQNEWILKDKSIYCVPELPTDSFWETIQQGNVGICRCRKSITKSSTKQTDFVNHCNEENSQDGFLPNCITIMHRCEERRRRWWWETSQWNFGVFLNYCNSEMMINASNWLNNRRKYIWAYQSSKSSTKIYRAVPETTDKNG